MWAALIKIIVGLGGAVMGGSAARDAAEYNAKVIQQKADSVAQAKEADTKTLQRQSRRLKSEQVAGYSKSGAMIGQGTPLLVMAEQSGDMQRDILNYRRNRLIEEQQLRSEAEAMRWSGRMQQRGAILGGITGGAQGMGTILGNKGGSTAGAGMSGTYGSAPKMDTLASGGKSYGSYNF